MLKIFAQTRILIFMVVILSTTLCISTYAANEAMMDLLKILHDKGSLTKEEFSMLQKAAMAEEQKTTESTTALDQKVEEVASSRPRVTTAGKFKVESQDGDYSFQPIGRIFWDSVWEDNDGSSAIAGGSELRRARMGFEAKIYKHWSAKVEYDFSGSDADLKDGWIAYSNLTAGETKYNIKVGQHHVPFGFNTTSSSKYMSFLRRPLFADGPLSPARQYGAAVRLDGKRWLIHAGGFLGEPGDGAVNVDAANEDARTLAIRVAGTPLKLDKTHLLHLGASYMNINLRGDALRVRQHAISHIDTSRLFDTGTFANGVIDDINAYDLEALAIWGPFHVLGEYVLWDMDNNSNGANDLSGWSFEAGWYLTGESMKYKGGQFSGVSPKQEFLNGGYGAWQLVTRYESMDLNDGVTMGGDGDVFSVGLNWLPVKNIRLMASYNKLVNFKQPGNANDGLHPSSFSVRSMVYW